VVRLRRSLGFPKRKANPVVNSKPRKPILPVSNFSLQNQMVLRFLFRQSDLVPGVKGLYWRIRRNPQVYQRYPSGVNVSLKSEYVLNITGNWKKDRRFTRNASTAMYCLRTARMIQKRLGSSRLSEDRKNELREQQSVLLEKELKLVGQNRQILIDFLYPNKPERSSK
jgi:hypothetical protein